MGRKKYRPNEFESSCANNDTFTMVFESMKLSPAFLDMTKNQRLLYIYMKGQFYGKRKPKADYPEIEEFQDERLFYFNRAMAVKYGLYSANNKQCFYDDIHAIELHGFIETFSNGKNTKRKSIYKFSSKWKCWNNNNN